MKNFFIFLSVLIIGTLAYVDAKDRLDKLDEISSPAKTKTEKINSTTGKKLISRKSSLHNQ